MEMMEPGPALVNGLGYVGTGKRGSDTCPPDVITSILTEARQTPPPANTLGAFFGGLWMKGVANEELAFEALLGQGALKDSQALLSYFSQGVPKKVLQQTKELMDGKIMNRAEAREMGEFLFSDSPGDSLRTLIATILRVRYASPEEYAGLLDVIASQYPPAFCEPVPEGKPIIQLAEPFDGVERSWILTPILMRDLTELGYRVVALCGRNPGPKKGYNLLDVAESLAESRFLKSNSQLGEENSYGWFLRQSDVAPSLDRWVEIRHQMKKRPSLATLEKYVSPFKADIFIGSAFHHNFGDKMGEIGECLKIPKVIVTFKTVEGSLGPSLGRATKIFTSDLESSGEYRHEEFDFKVEDFGLTNTPDPKDFTPGLEKNCELIRNYFATGESGDAYFDQRVTAAREMLSRVLG
ncbi:MAG: hypothetical protein H6624_01840 [Bdellovibrionaceae bacterium]|nr:hypothetical protein [Bdellovibrionales bacterium]MCB9083050.1 hypothetical protein [Pseudobdellovibrionaceae bacterium]